jgi:uncharacterized metal-binding protein YceD (DUF177 family)
MTMPQAEFSRMVDATRFDGKPVEIEANETERAALARRFGLISIGRLEAQVTLMPDGEAVLANGTLSASIAQSCAVSGEDLPVLIEEPLALRFVPEKSATTDDEVEPAEDELDEIPFAGKSFDLGEAVAQSLALAIDPYATGPQADEARQKALGDDASGPFAALSKLKN